MDRELFNPLFSFVSKLILNHLHLINLCLDSSVTLLTYVKTWILGNVTMFLRYRLLKA